MKNLLCMLAVSGSLIQGADEPTAKITGFSPESVHVLAGAINYACGRFDTVKRGPKNTSVCNSSIYKLCKDLSKNDTIVHELTGNASIVDQANIYENKVKENQVLVGLISYAQGLSKTDTYEARKASIPLINHMFLEELKKLVEADTELTIYFTKDRSAREGATTYFSHGIEATIETNARCNLDDKQKICLQGTFLVMLRNLEALLTIDRLGFEWAFHHYLPKKLRQCLTTR